MQRQYEGKVEVVGVAGRSEFDAMADFVALTGVGDFPHLADLELEVWQTFGIRGQPAFAFINDDGQFEIHQGALGEENLVAAVEALIAA